MRGSFNDLARPKVIVHILQSIDGRISGGYFAHAMPYLPDYAEIRHELEGDAVMYGATTAEELFASPRPDLSAFEGGNVPAGDFVCETDSFHFLVLDPSGTLGYTSGTARRNDIEGHIVALLHHDVDPAYLVYLRSIGVSYVLAGWGAIDVQEALAKVGELFGISRVLLMGGGMANATVAAPTASTSSRSWWRRSLPSKMVCRRSSIARPAPGHSP